jgi:hypothetical protein
MIPRLKVRAAVHVLTSKNNRRWIVHLMHNDNTTLIVGRQWQLHLTRVLITERPVRLHQSAATECRSTNIRHNVCASTCRSYRLHRRRHIRVSVNEQSNCMPYQVQTDVRSQQVSRNSRHKLGLACTVQTSDYKLILEFVLTFQFFAQERGR